MTNSGLQISLTADSQILAMWGPSVASSTKLQVECSRDTSPVVGASVQLRAESGAISIAGRELWSHESVAETNDEGVAHFDFSAEIWTDVRPGSVNFEAVVTMPAEDAKVARGALLVIGNPAFIAMTAAPSSLVCGEASAILITLTDALNQNVPDETVVHLSTNLGGVLVPSNPKTFGGVAFAFLLTSEVHSGSYVVVAQTVNDPPGRAPISSMVTVEASRGAIPKSPFDEMLASLVQVRPDLFSTGTPAAGVVAPQVRTILFSDIESSTSLALRVGDQNWTRILSEHDEILRQEIESNGGVITKHTGDGFMCSFERPGDAVRSSIAIQRRLADYRAKHPGEARGDLRVRIGMRSGEVTPLNDDLFGATVILAHRVLEAAAGSEALVSEATRSMVRGSPDILFLEEREILPKGESRKMRVSPVDWRPAP